MEGRDRTADAMHAEVEKYADRCRPSLHDFIDGQLGCRKRYPSHSSSLTIMRHRSLRWHKHR
jgi:hypothetical protein